MSQYASAAYCSNNSNSPGDKVRCGSGNCPVVEHANSTTVLEYSKYVSPSHQCPAPTHSLKNRNSYRRDRLRRPRPHQQSNRRLLPRLPIHRQLAHEPRLRTCPHRPLLSVHRTRRVLAVLDRRAGRCHPRRENDSRCVPELPNCGHGALAGRCDRGVCCGTAAESGDECRAVYVWESAGWRYGAEFLYKCAERWELSRYALE